MIDRRTYLEMCQAVSVILASGGKQNIPESLFVVLDGTKYYPLSYSLSFDGDGNAVHRAVLHDLHANSINGCLLSELDFYENAKALDKTIQK